MSKKEKFIEEIDDIIKNGLTLSEDAMIFFEAMKQTEDETKPILTDKGKEILKYLQDNIDTLKNSFTSKMVGEGMGIPSKSISGSMRSLASKGFIEKLGDKPVIYSLTDEGKNFNVDEA